MCGGHERRDGVTFWTVDGQTAGTGDDQIHDRPGEGCCRQVCMGMNPLVMAALNGDVDSGCHADR